MFGGQYKLALHHANLLQEELTPELVRQAPGAMIQEGFFSVLWHVYIRFGKWDEILSTPIPADEELYPMAIATAHYARGIALASLGRVEEAEAEQEAFLKALKHPLMWDRVMINNVAYRNGQGIFQVGVHMLLG